MVRKGQTLMRIVNTAGEEVERFIAPYEGVIIGVKANPITLAGETIGLFAKVVRTENKQ
jgi:predicted deacylase